MERARTGSPQEIRQLVHDRSTEVLDALLSNPALSEEHLLLLLNRKDLPRELLETVAANEELVKSQRVKAALVRHPKTSRLVSVRFLKFLYLFDLVAVSLEAAVPGEIKRLAEEQIINRLQQLPLGQQVALARQAPCRVLAALLLLGNDPVIPVGLDNPRLTEAGLLEVLREDELNPLLVEQIAQHPKWSRQYSVRLQLVRHPQTPLAVALGFLPAVKLSDLRVLASDHRMPDGLRQHVREEAERRTRRRRPSG
jgi:hypothetical protein